MKADCLFIRVIKHLFICVSVILIGLSLLYCASSFEIDYPNTGNLLAYIGCFVGIPAVLLLLLWKKKPVRWYFLAMLLVVSILSSFWYHQGIVVQETDPAHYLTEKTAFNNVAKMVLPAPEALNEEAQYCYTKANSGIEIIQLTIVLPKEEYKTFYDEQQRMFSQLQGTLSGPPYYFISDPEGMTINNHTYQCYKLFLDGTDYAVAYSGCAETGTVSYLFFSTWELSSCSVADAFAYDFFDISQND